MPFRAARRSILHGPLDVLRLRPVQRSPGSGDDPPCGGDRRDLTYGSDLMYEPQGSVALRGFDEPWELYRALE